MRIKMRAIINKSILTISCLFFSATVTVAQAPATQKSAQGEKALTEDQALIDSDGQTSITEALSSAYLTNSDLQAKLHEQYSKHEAINQAISGFRPSVSINGQQSRIDSKTNFPVKNRTKVSPYSSAVEVQQNIFNSFGTWYGWDSAEKGVKAGFYDLVNTEQKTLLSAAEAYLNVIFRKASVTFNQSNVKFLAEQLKAARAAVEVGEKTVTDIAQAESRLAQGNAQLSAAEGELQNAIANYENIVGKRPGTLTYPDGFTDLPTSRELFIEESLNNNPAVKSALFNYEKARSDVKVAGSELLPRVDLSGSANRSLHQRNNKDRTDQIQGTIKLTVPIYQSGAKWSSLRQRSEIESQARFQLEQARKSVTESATKAWEGLASAQKQTISLRKQVEFAKISLDGVILQVQVGERPTIDILDAQKEYLQAQTGLEEARKNERLAEFQIKAVGGKLTAHQLALPVELYDVQGHLDSVKYQLFGLGPDTSKKAG